VGVERGGRRDGGGIGLTGPLTLHKQTHTRQHVQPAGGAVLQGMRHGTCIFFFGRFMYAYGKEVDCLGGREAEKVKRTLLFPPRLQKCAFLCACGPFHAIYDSAIFLPVSPFLFFLLLTPLSFTLPPPRPPLHRRHHHHSASVPRRWMTGSFRACRGARRST
jgi:hypothetical protein